MIEYGLLKASGGKVFGGLFMPSAVLIIGGVLAWQLWQDKKAIRELKQQIKDTPLLKRQLTDLQMAQHTVAEQISSLQSELHALPAIATPAPANFTPSFTEKILPSPSTPKLAMLKRLLEDNLTLRKNL